MKNEPIAHERKRIFWLSWNRNPYNDYLFNELSRDFDLQVFYLKEVFSSHPWINKEPLAFGYTDLTTFSGIIKAFKSASKESSLRVIAGWNHYLMILMILFLAATGKRFSIWSDTPDVHVTRNQFKNTFRKIWLNFVFRHAKWIMVTGQIGVERMKEIGVPGSKIVNFPFATDLDYFKPAEQRETDAAQGIVFLSSGRLVNSHKGFDIAIKAFGIIKRKHPDSVFSYHIAGSGADEMLLRALIKEEGLEKNIVLKGWIQREELLGFYHSGDVFIHPSHFDPFPNVVLEALATGLPVIGSDAAGSVRDRITDGSNGYIFSDGNIEELVSQVEKLLLNPQLVKAMQVQARSSSLDWDVSFNIRQIHTLTA